MCVRVPPADTDGRWLVPVEARGTRVSGVWARICMDGHTPICMDEHTSYVWRDIRPHAHPEGYSRGVCAEGIWEGGIPPYIERVGALPACKNSKG
jgi:hypothetical protein